VHAGLVRPDEATWIPVGGEATTVASPQAVVGLIEKNLALLGINPLMARHVGFEAVSALSLGQVVFFGGPLARPAAEAVGVSLADAALRIVRVPLGATEPIPLDAPAGDAVVLIDGANRGCLDIWGPDLKRTAARRALRCATSPLPAYLATLDDGPSALPVHPGLLTLGPVIDTGLLAWKPSATEPKLLPGHLGQFALSVPDWALDKDAKESWESLLKAIPSSGGYWLGHALATIQCLVALAKLVDGMSPPLSFLGCWLIPWLAASGRPLDAYAEVLSGAQALAGKKVDPRLKALLGAHGLGDST
jgi:hypothetical protein